MLSRLLGDGIKGGRALTKAREGLEEALESIISMIQARIGAAGQSIGTLISPIVEALTGIAAEFGSVDSPEEGFRVLARLLLFCADVLENLSAEAIEAIINQVISIVTDDLGLSRARIIEFVNEVIDKIVQKMNSISFPRPK